jgi:hypothetical protein
LLQGIDTYSLKLEKHLTPQLLQLSTAGKVLPIVGEGIANLENKSMKKVTYVPGMCKKSVISREVRR